MLRDVNFEAVYRSECDNILEDFYIPALANSILYERAVGFFSASVLSYAAQGLSALVSNGGAMKLIIGYEVDSEDEEAIIKGYDLKEVGERIGVSMVQAFDEVSDTLFSRRLEALSWLIASGKLDIKIALRKKGMYHEKIGIFTDANGDKVIFQGSANETTYGLLPDFNFESINVFPSWKKELRDHYQPYLAGFQSLWEDRAGSTRVIDFPQAVKDNLIQRVKKSPRVFTVEQELSFFEPQAVFEEAASYQFVPKVPELYKGKPFNLGKHQLAALNAWKAAGGMGVLELATGAGKTITAIYGAVRWFEASERLFLVIAAPYQNLADQWVDELRNFSIVPIRCYVSTARWQSEMHDAIARFNSGAQNFCCAVVVNATLASTEFQACLSKIDGKSLMWIGDECHHHGSSSSAKALPETARLRLGLSATPSHYMDDDANQRLENYYGSTVSKYTLKQALDDEVLTPYKYHVVPVELTDVEAEQYLDLSAKISQAFAVASGKSSDGNNSNLKMLLLARSRLLSSAQNKLVALDALLEKTVPDPHTLFYCGDGRVEDPIDGEESRQIEAVSQLLYQRGWKTSRFTSKETRSVREDLLNHFRLKMIDGLVAIRCLDEGIDVPACKRAYLLASSRNPRQQIQRRGRILRKAAGKDYAEIYDFLVTLPPELVGDGGHDRKLLIQELERVAEFASLAMNHGDVVKSLLPILQQYGLSHLLVLDVEDAVGPDSQERLSMHDAAEKALREIDKPTHIKDLAQYMQDKEYFLFTADDAPGALDTCLSRRCVDVERGDHAAENIFYRFEASTYGLLEEKLKG